MTEQKLDKHVLNSLRACVFPHNAPGQVRAHSDTCIKFVSDAQRKHDWDAFPQHQRERQDSELKWQQKSLAPLTQDPRL